MLATKGKGGQNQSARTSGQNQTRFREVSGLRHRSRVPYPLPSPLFTGRLLQGLLPSLALSGLCLPGPSGQVLWPLSPLFQGWPPLPGLFPGCASMMASALFLPSFFSLLFLLSACASLVTCGHFFFHNGLLQWLA